MIEERKPDPYRQQLASDMEKQADFVGYRLDHPVAELLAGYLDFTLIEPKNKRIHELHVKLARLEAQIERLGRVIDRHSPGVRKDGERAIDCAIRLLSPVPDNVPARNRP